MICWYCFREAVTNEEFCNLTQASYSDLTERKVIIYILKQINLLSENSRSDHSHIWEGDILCKHWVLDIIYRQSDNKSYMILVCENGSDRHFHSIMENLKVVISNSFLTDISSGQTPCHEFFHFKISLSCDEQLK